MAGLLKTTFLTEEIGSIKIWGSATIPAGWLECKGDAVSRTTYAALFSIIGTSFGTGDGSTTFNLPDYRAAAVTGVGTSTGYTSDETVALGTKYDDRVQGHYHDLNTNVNNGFAVGGESIRAGSLTPNNSTVFDTLAPTTDGINGTPRIGNTTRMKNVGSYYIIKY